VALLPGIEEQRVADVVVARYVVERHVQPVHEAVELLPPGRVQDPRIRPCNRRIRSPVDSTNSGLEQLELGQRAFKDAGPVCRLLRSGKNGKAENGPRRC